MQGVVFFFGVKKEPKNLWGDASPKPRRPWRSGARSQLGLRIKRGFVNFCTKPLFFYSYPRGSINTKQCQVQVHLRTRVLKHLTRFCCLCN